jgi:mRNA interferase HigB
MNTIKYKAIKDFVPGHPDAKPSLDRWYKIARKAKWKSLTEVRETFPHADLVGELTVFNIGGNNYRLITYINYQYETIYIKAILTHDEYDQGKWKS